VIWGVEKTWSPSGELSVGDIAVDIARLECQQQIVFLYNGKSDQKKTDIYKSDCRISTP